MTSIRSSLPSRLRQLLSGEGSFVPSVKLDSETVSFRYSTIYIYKFLYRHVYLYTERERERVCEIYIAAACEYRALSELLGLLFFDLYILTALDLIYVIYRVFFWFVFNWVEFLISVWLLVLVPIW